MANNIIHLWVEYHRKKEEKYVCYPAVKDDDGNIIDEEESKVLDTKWKASWGWTQFLYTDHLMAVSLTETTEDDSDEKKLRGLPDDVSFEVKQSTLSLLEEEHLHYPGDEPFPTPYLMGNGFGQGFGDIDMHIEKRGLNPRFHDFSWCNAKELEDCIKKNYYDEETQKYNPDAIDWLILLGAMNALNNIDNIECRVVFWFEN